MLDNLVLAVIASIFCLDITAYGQFMISRPVVCGPVIGYLLGDVKTGLWIGMIVELVWLGVIPMGAAVPQDSTTICIFTLIWGIGSIPGNKGAMVLAFVMATLAGFLYREIDIWVRYYNINIMHWVEEGVKKGFEKRICYGTYLGLILFFVKGVVFFFLLIYPGQWLVSVIYPALPEIVKHGFGFSWKILPLLGFAIIFVNLHNKNLFLK